jgi:surface antigen
MEFSMRSAARGVVAILLVSVTACTGMPPDNRTIGTVAGAGVGAIIGNQFGSGTGNVIATVVGAAAGAYIGQRIGQYLDERDRLAMNQSTQTALTTAPLGQPVPWSNPQNMHSGTVTATRQSQQMGRNCRTIEQSVFVNGQPQAEQTTFCQQPDGTWTRA